MKTTPLESWVCSRLGLSESPRVPLLQAYQLARLRDTLAYAGARSRFYRRRLADIDPDSIRTIEDVARIPFTRPRDIAENPNDFLCVSPGSISRVVTLSTSGTTGAPKKIAFTSEDQERTLDFFHYGMTVLARPFDRVLIFMPGKTEGSVGDLLKKALARFDCEGIIFGPIDDYARASQTLLDIRPDSAVGIPTQLLALSRFHRDPAAGSLRLRTVLLSTDYVSPAVTAALEQAWGCEVYGHYGTTEMGLGGAVECQARNGYHLREADLLFEVVDPDTGKPVKEGEYGEVVFSTLTRRGMPLIRYRTGDGSRLLPGPCPCGSVLRRLDRISGRIGASRRLADGSCISIGQIDDILFADPSVLAYSAEISFKDGCDCLALTVQPAQEFLPVARIQSSFECDPRLGKLIKGGSLKLEVRKGDDHFFTTGTSKRIIVLR